MLKFDLARVRSHAPRNFIVHLDVFSNTAHRDASSELLSGTITAPEIKNIWGTKAINPIFSTG